MARLGLWISRLSGDVNTKRYRSIRVAWYETWLWAVSDSRPSGIGDGRLLMDEAWVAKGFNWD